MSFLGARGLKADKREGKVKNPYVVLGVSPSSSDVEIEQARHRLFALYHAVAGSEPDEERMADVEWAFGVLRNPGQRAHLDRSLANEIDSMERDTSSLATGSVAASAQAEQQRTQVDAHAQSDWDAQGYEGPGQEWTPYPPPAGVPWRGNLDDVYPPFRWTPRQAFLSILLSSIMCFPAGLVLAIIALSKTRQNPWDYKASAAVWVALFLGLWTTFLFILLTVANALPSFMS